MPFILLLMFALVLMVGHDDWPASWLDGEASAALVAGTMLASWLSAAALARILCRQATRYPEQRYSLLRLYAKARRLHFFGLLAIYLGVLFFFGWGRTLLEFFQQRLPESLRSQDNLPGFQLGLMLPIFAGLLLAWERFYHFEKCAYEAAHDSIRFISKSAYLLMQVRQQFLFVMPPIVLHLLQQVLFALFHDGGDEPSMWLAGIAFGMMIVAFIAMPIFLRLFLGLKPLPAGALRERLTEAARRLGFRYSNILVWNTRNTVANAMVTGFIPWVRYIILTDRLIDELTPEEIEAVFGHEVGHIRHHHLVFYLAFFLTSFILLGLIWTGVAELLGRWGIGESIASWTSADPAEIRAALPIMGSVLKLSLLAGYALLVFGFISRRCERQADLYGAGAVSTDAFISALEKVADINGISRSRYSWLHPTINQRVEFLRSMRDEPVRAKRFNLSVLAMQLALYVVLGLLLWSNDIAYIGQLLSAF